MDLDLKNSSTFELIDGTEIDIYDGCLVREINAFVVGVWVCIDNIVTGPFYLSKEEFNLSEFKFSVDYDLTYFPVDKLVRYCENCAGVSVYCIGSENKILFQNESDYLKTKLLGIL